MAISVPNTLSDLHQMAIRLGIESSIQGTKKDGSRSKEDYITPIREKILSDRYSSIPEYMKLLLHLKSPMLSKRIDEVNSDIQNEVWEDPIWSLEEKIIGVRSFLIKDASGFHIFSRENSKEDLLPIEMTNRVCVPNFDIDKMKVDSFILDCEISSNCLDICNMLYHYGILTDTSDEALSILFLNLHPLISKRIQAESNFDLVFNVFDCLYVNGHWLMNETLRKRREVVAGVLKSVEGCGIPFRQTQWVTQFKTMYLSKQLSEGHEGCIAKREDGVYIADTSRKRNGWLKIKMVRNSDSEVEVGDTIDAFITGFAPGEKNTLCEGFIYSLEVSVYVKSEKRILTNIININSSLRSEMTELIGDIPTLKPIFYNKVVELDAGCKTLLKLRYDKNSDDCIMSEELYENLKENY